MRAIRNPMKKNYILLQEAQSVFGSDLVINAYITMPETTNISNNENNLDIISDQEYTDGELVFNHDRDVILEFINGRKINFGSSEWASAYLIEDNQFYEVV